MNVKVKYNSVVPQEKKHRIFGVTYCTNYKLFITAHYNVLHQYQEKTAMQINEFVITFLFCIVVFSFASIISFTDDNYIFINFRARGKESLVHLR